MKPPAQTTMFAADLVRDLNPAQAAAVLHVDGPARVRSGAGSGKTRVIVHRIANLIENHGIKPERILATTYSNRGGAVIAERCAALLRHKRVKVKTFHALVREILSKSLAGFDGFEAAERAERRYVQMVKQAIGARGMKWRGADLGVFLAFVALAKADGARPGSARAAELAAERAARRGHRPEVNAELTLRAYGIVEAERDASGVMTFADWLVEAAEMLERHEEVRAYWASKFDVVMVDEGQDNSHVQTRIATALARDHRQIMLIGDRNQTIFSWIGARPDIFAGFVGAWGAVDLQLADNYRSGRAIVAAANRVAAAMADPDGGVTMAAVRDAAGAVAVSEHETPEAEGAAVAEALLALRAGGAKWRDCAALYRTNTTSRALQEALTRAAVPFYVVGGAPFYELPEIAPLVGYLRMAVRGEASLDHASRSLRNPHRYLGRAFFDALEGALATHGPTGGWPAALEAAADESGAHDNSRAKVRDWWALVERLRAKVLEGATPQEVLNLVLKETDYVAYVRGEEGAATVDDDRATNITELLRAATAYATPLGFLKHVDAATEASRAASAAGRSDSPPDRVALMTVHRSKGLEWDHVFLIGCNEGVFPHALAEDPEEELRLFYVAVTRPRDGLHASWARTATTQGRVRPMNPSRYLELLEDAPRVPRARVIDWDAVEAASLDAIDDCPVDAADAQRYFQGDNEIE